MMYSVTSVCNSLLCVIILTEMEMCVLFCFCQVKVAVDEAKNEHEILQTFAEGADAPLQ